eukprot:scaffold45512_cov19-Prasinocladus_malaysianus.AAC.1
MQTVNVLPWELVQSQHQFHKDMKRMFKDLDKEKGFSEDYFPFLYKRVYGQRADEHKTYLDVLKEAEFLGVKLTYEQSDFKGSLEQAFKDLQHMIADWIENMNHFFKVRFIDDTHQKVQVMAKCLDLRLFCVRSFPKGMSLDQYLAIEVKQPFATLWKWAKDAGINVYPEDECWSAMCILAKRLHDEVTSFYAGASSSGSFHPWHDEKQHVNVSGTVIQKVVFTKTKYNKDVGPFLHIYE